MVPLLSRSVKLLSENAPPFTSIRPWLSSVVKLLIDCPAAAAIRPVAVFVNVPKFRIDEPDTFRLIVPLLS